MNTEKPNRKTALITGASRGIGKAIAEVFAAAGYDLALTCLHSITELEELADRLETCFGVRCRARQADAGCFEAMQAVFAELKQVDVLVNNAGISHIGLLSEMTPDEWRRVMSTNLDACFYTCKLAVPLMLRSHSGKIINISSVWGSAGASMETAYSASKGALNAFTKALAKELAPSNIQVNAVSCGVIDTEMNGFLTQEERDALKAEIPADRLGTPREVAELVLQTAASPAYMTGQVINIDGGWY